MVRFLVKDPDITQTWIVEVDDRNGMVEPTVGTVFRRFLECSQRASGSGSVCRFSFSIGRVDLFGGGLDAKVLPQMPDPRAQLSVTRQVGFPSATCRDPSQCNKCQKLLKYVAPPPPESITSRPDEGPLSAAIRSPPNKSGSGPAMASPRASASFENPAGEETAAIPPPAVAPAATASVLREDGSPLFSSGAPLSQSGLFEGVDMASQLERVASMFKQGYLTETEFKLAKSKILRLDSPVFS